jgi:hypothetical protein
MSNPKNLGSRPPNAFYSLDIKGAFFFHRDPARYNQLICVWDTLLSIIDSLTAHTCSGSPVANQAPHPRKGRATIKTLAIIYYSIKKLIVFLWCAEARVNVGGLKAP